MVQRSNSINTLRQIAQSRIEFIVQQLYRNCDKSENIKIFVFGSCATGLSIPTSDVDIEISGFDNILRADAIQILKNLNQIL